MERGKAMREARLRAGLTLMQLEEKSGISRHTIGRMERGDHDANLVSVVMCADALNISVDEYIGRKPFRTPCVNMEPVTLALEETTREYVAKQGTRILGRAGTLAEITDVIRCRTEYA